MSYWNVPIHPVVVPVLSLLEAAFFALGGLCLGWSDGYNPHRSGRGTRGSAASRSGNCLTTALAATSAGYVTILLPVEATSESAWAHISRGARASCCQRRKRYRDIGCYSWTSGGTVRVHGFPMTCRAMPSSETSSQCSRSSSLGSARCSSGSRWEPIPRSSSRWHDHGS